MKYETTPIKKHTSSDVKRITLKTLDDISTMNILWYLVKRHKFGLVASWAILVTVVYLFPPLPDLVISLI